MTSHRNHLRRSPRPLPLLLGLLLGSLCGPAWAQPAAAGDGQVYGLTDLQKAQVLAAGSAARGDPALAQPPAGANDGQIHGQLDAVVGTGGARGVSGTAAIPLGQSGGAVVSFERSRFGRRGYR